MVKTRIRPVTELGYPKARAVPDYPDYEPMFPKESNEGEKEPSENRTSVVKQNHTEKFKRNKQTEK